MPEYSGNCICGDLKYSLTLDSVDDGRASLCHCSFCQRALGGNYGLTVKVPVSTFKYTESKPKAFKASNGVTREWCDNCGTYICEYGAEAVDKFRYLMWGTLDDPQAFPPKVEFFCKYKPQWMPDIPDIAHKKEIHE